MNAKELAHFVARRGASAIMCELYRLQCEWIQQDQELADARAGLPPGFRMSEATENAAIAFKRESAMADAILRHLPLEAFSDLLLASRGYDTVGVTSTEWLRRMDLANHQLVRRGVVL